MKSFLVDKKEAGARLDKFVQRKAPSLPKSLLYKIFRKGDIKLNGKRCRDFAVILSAGDSVDIFASDEFFAKEKPNYDFLSASKDLAIVYEDDNILIADKQAGVLCHPAKGQYTDTLLSRVCRYLYEKGEYDPEEGYTPALANRIDRGTAGLVLLAKNPAALRSLCRRIKDHTIEKHYLAAVTGEMKKAKGEMHGFLSKNSAKNKVSLTRDESAYEALLRYELLLADRGKSLVDIHLITGFSHQIRVQFSASGHPLIGDMKYGASHHGNGISRQALYSWKLTFCKESGEDILSYLEGKSFYAAEVPFAKELFGVSSANISDQDCGTAKPPRYEAHQ